MILSSGTCSIFQSLYFPNADTGYVVGIGGTILKTTNGGASTSGSDDLRSKTNKLSIYPDPSSFHLTIETSVIPTISQLSIMNLNGQEVLTRQITQHKTTIDISHLPCGVYFVRLTNDKSVEVGKFIKQ